MTTASAETSCHSLLKLYKDKKSIGKWITSFFPGWGGHCVIFTRHMLRIAVRVGAIYRSTNLEGISYRGSKRPSEAVQIFFYRKTNNELERDFQIS